MVSLVFIPYYKQILFYVNYITLTAVDMNTNMYSMCLFCSSLIKEELSRPKYNKLLQDKFILRAENEKVDVAAYVTQIMDEMANNGISAFTTNLQ